eukprot:jgi/Bigna1/73904/fgenesh1_pg.26_\
MEIAGCDSSAEYRLSYYLIHTDPELKRNLKKALQKEHTKWEYDAENDYELSVVNAPFSINGISFVWDKIQNSICDEMKIVFCAIRSLPEATVFQNCMGEGVPESKGLSKLRGMLSRMLEDYFLRQVRQHNTLLQASEVQTGLMETYRNVIAYRRLWKFLDEKSDMTETLKEVNFKYVPKHPPHVNVAPEPLENLLGEWEQRMGFLPNTDDTRNGWMGWHRARKLKKKEDDIDRDIMRKLSTNKQKDYNKLKILLLGYNALETMRFFRALSILRGGDASHQNRFKYKEEIFRIVLEGVLFILKLANKEALSESQKCQRIRKRIMDRKDLGCDKALFQDVKTLLTEDAGFYAKYAASQTWKEGGLSPHTLYFLSHFDRIGSDGYEPSKEDILHTDVDLQQNGASSSLNSLREFTMDYNGHFFHFVCLPGYGTTTRRTRQGLLLACEDFNMLIYCADLTSYARQENGKSEIERELREFEEIMNSRQRKPLADCKALEDLDEDPVNTSDALSSVASAFEEKLYDGYVHTHVVEATDVHSVTLVGCSAGILDGINSGGDSGGVFYGAALEAKRTPQISIKKKRRHRRERKKESMLQLESSSPSRIVPSSNVQTQGRLTRKSSRKSHPPSSIPLKRIPEIKTKVSDALDPSSSMRGLQESKVRPASTAIPTKAPEVEKELAVLGKKIEEKLRDVTIRSDRTSGLRSERAQIPEFATNFDKYDMDIEEDEQVEIAGDEIIEATTKEEIEIDDVYADMENVGCNSKEFEVFNFLSWLTWWGSKQDSGVFDTWVEDQFHPHPMVSSVGSNICRFSMSHLDEKSISGRVTADISESSILSIDLFQRDFKSSRNQGSSKLNGGWYSVHGQKVVTEGLHEWRIRINKLPESLPKDNTWGAAIGIALERQPRKKSGNAFIFHRSSSQEPLPYPEMKYGFLMTGKTFEDSELKSKTVPEIYAREWREGEIITVSVNLEKRTLRYHLSGKDAGVSHNLPSTLPSGYGYSLVISSIVSGLEVQCAVLSYFIAVLISLLLVLPACLYLLASRFKNIQRHMDDYEIRQELLAQESTAKKSLRCISIATRSIPVLGLLVGYPLIVVYLILDSGSEGVSELEVGLSIGIFLILILILQALGTYRSFRSFEEMKADVFETRFKRQSQRREVQQIQIPSPHGAGLCDISVKPVLDTFEHQISVPKSALRVEPIAHEAPPTVFLKFRWFNLVIQLSSFGLQSISAQEDSPQSNRRDSESDTETDEGFYAVFYIDIQSYIESCHSSLGSAVYLSTTKGNRHMPTGLDRDAGRVWFYSVPGAVVYGHGDVRGLSSSLSYMAVILADTLLIVIMTKYDSKLVDNVAWTTRCVCEHTGPKREVLGGGPSILCCFVDGFLWNLCALGIDDSPDAWLVFLHGKVKQIQSKTKQLEVFQQESLQPKIKTSLVKSIKSPSFSIMTNFLLVAKPFLSFIALMKTALVISSGFFGSNGRIAGILASIGSGVVLTMATIFWMNRPSIRFGYEILGEPSTPPLYNIARTVGLAASIWGGVLAVIVLSYPSATRDIKFGILWAGVIMMFISGYFYYERYWVTRVTRIAKKAEEDKTHEKHHQSESPNDDLLVVTHAGSPEVNGIYQKMPSGFQYKKMNVVLGTVRLELGDGGVTAGYGLCAENPNARSVGDICTWYYLSQSRKLPLANGSTLYKACGLGPVPKIRTINGKFVMRLVKRQERESKGSSSQHDQSKEEHWIAAHLDAHQTEFSQ